MSVSFAIVGRPNVGKSTLFNRLIGRQHAIVDDQPGVTRDRREGQGQLASLSFTVIDTAGLEDVTDGSLEERMRRQTEMAIIDADVTLLVVDAKAGVTPVDSFFANEIRKAGANVILLANKCEGKAGVTGLAEAWSLGLGEPVAISASHGDGLVDLHNAMLAAATELGLDDALIGNASAGDGEDIFTNVDQIEENETLKVNQLTYGKMKRFCSQCGLPLLVAQIWENPL